MFDKIEAKLQKEQFYPSFLGLFVNPFYFARKGLLQELLSLSHVVHGKVLDIGCGKKPYRELFLCDEYVGLEIDTQENRTRSKADYFYDGIHIPFHDATFDFLIITQVFEHVFDPESFLQELLRVLKKGGMMIMTVPFVWDEHEQPNDYARYSSFGLRYILTKYGFNVIKQRKTLADVRILFQLVNLYIYKMLIKIKNSYLRNAFIILFTTPFNIMGELMSRVFPANTDIYLDNVILLRKETDHA
jgi:SAM-dependent methyltransferase